MPVSLLPYALVAFMLWSGVIYGVGHGRGIKEAKNEAAAEKLLVVEMAKKEFQANAVIDMSAALEVGQSQQRTRTVIRTIRESVADARCTDNRLDEPNFLRWQSANAAQPETLTAGKLSPTLSTAPTTPRLNANSSGAESR